MMSAKYPSSKPATTDALDLTKVQTQYRETLRLEAISGTVYTPNFVPAGSLMDSITSFLPSNNSR